MTSFSPLLIRLQSLVQNMVIVPQQNIQLYTPYKVAEN